MMIVLVGLFASAAIVLAWFEGKLIGERNVYREWRDNLVMERERRQRELR